MKTKPIFNSTNLPTIIFNIAHSFQTANENKLDVAIKITDANELFPINNIEVRIEKLKFDERHRLASENWFIFPHYMTGLMFSFLNDILHYKGN